MTNDIRDIFHQILKERSLSQIGVSAHQYAMLDAMEKRIRESQAGMVKRLEKDDGS